jgi:hypothetical protein
MSIRQLRARLDRLEQRDGITLSDNIAENRWRRIWLGNRQVVAKDLTKKEEAELLALHAFFQDEDRAIVRRLDLYKKKELNEDEGEEPLTDNEAAELAELQRRYPDPMRKSVEAWGKAAKEHRLSNALDQLRKRPKR